MSRAAHLFRRVNGLDQATGDIISFESNDEASLEQATETVVDTQVAIASLEQQAQVLDDVVSVMSSLVASMEASVATGGVQPRDMMFANMAIQGQLARIGESMDVISHESVGGALTRVEATQTASTALLDKLKALWERITAAIRAAWDHVTRFFRGLFTATGQLRRRAQRLHDETRSLSVVNNVDKTLDLGDALARRLMIKRKVSYVPADMLKELAAVTLQLSEHSIEVGAKNGEELSKLLHLQSISIFDHNTIRFVNVGKFTPPSQFTHVGKTYDRHERHGMVEYEQYVSPRFPGERYIQVNVPSADLTNRDHYMQNPAAWFKDLSTVMGGLQVRVIRSGHADAETYAPDSTEIPMPSVGEIEDIARETIHVAEMFERFTREAENTQRGAVAQLNKMTGQIWNERGGKMISGQGATIMMLASAYGRVARQLLLPATTLCSLTVTIATDVLHMGEKALDAYRPKEQGA